jgi:uncharacterized protein (DUF488 family)
MKQNIEIQTNNIFTIGHGTRSIEVFIVLLKAYKIETVIDVRSIPYSRFNPQYRQSNLILSLKEAGINYLFLGDELGGRPKDRSLYLNDKPNYLVMKDTEIFKAGIQRVLKLVKDGIKVTLMCSESDPNECHRKHLIEGELTNHSISVLHINKVGELEKHISYKDLRFFN